MKTLLLAASILLFASIGQAQDTLFLRNKESIPAQVLEISETTIIYKKWGNLSGPDYKIAVASVSAIVFENGTIERFKARSPRSFEITSRRAATIIKNKKLYPQTLPNNFIEAGFFIGNKIYNTNNNYYELKFPEEQYPTQGFFIKYQRLLANERIGIGMMPFIAFNRKNYGVKFNATFFTKSFGKFRIGIGSYYSIARQKHVHFYSVQAGEQSATGWAYLIDKNATVGSVGFSTVALLHLNKKSLLSFGADIGGLVHSNNYKSLPESWTKQPAGRGVASVGELRLGIIRRF